MSCKCFLFAETTVESVSSSVSRGIHSWLARDWTGAGLPPATQTLDSEAAEIPPLTTLTTNSTKATLSATRRSALGTVSAGGGNGGVIKEAITKQVEHVGALIGKHVESMHSRVSFAVGASLQNAQQPSSSEAPRTEQTQASPPQLSS